MVVKPRDIRREKKQDCFQAEKDSHKPCYHMDSNIWLGALIPDDERMRIKHENFLKDIINDRHKTVGASVVIMGEIIKKLKENLDKDKDAFFTALDFFGKLIFKGKLKVHSICPEDNKIVDEIVSETRIRADLPELIELTVMIKERSGVFVTMEKIADNQILREYMNNSGISIKRF